MDGPLRTGGNSVASDLEPEALIEPHRRQDPSQERRRVAELELIDEARPPHPQGDRRAVGEGQAADIDDEPRFD